VNRPAQILNANNAKYQQSQPGCIEKYGNTVLADVILGKYETKEEEKTKLKGKIESRRDKLWGK
jgi:hypothetical protein